MKKLYLNILLSLLSIMLPTLIFANQNIDSQKLSSYIQAHPDGFTINPYTLKSPENGYVVAPVKEAEIKIKYSNINSQNINQYIQEINFLSTVSKHDIYAGGWLNNDDNYYYLDAVYVEDNKNNALYIAKAAEQIAIYSLQDNEEINTDNAIVNLKKKNKFNESQYQNIEADISRLSSEYSLYKKAA